MNERIIICNRTAQHNNATHNGLVDAGAKASGLIDCSHPFMSKGCKNSLAVNESRCSRIVGYMLLKNNVAHTSSILEAM